MSTTLNKAERVIRGGGAWACLLGLFALAASGCSNHGPVGIVSPELFGKYLNAPQLVFSSATQVSFTVSSTSNSPCIYTYQTTYNGNYISVPNFSAIVVNAGGTGTYGPLQATFSAPGFTNPATDPIVITFEGNDRGNNDWVTPQGGADPPLCGDCGTAISNLGSGSEISASSQVPVALYQGYFNNNNQNSGYVDDSLYMSAAFVVSPGTAAWTGQWINVLVNMNIKDGYGTNYFSSFYIYVQPT